MSTWTHKVLEKIDAEKIRKEWLEYWKPNLTFDAHGTGPYQNVDGVPCHMRYYGAETKEAREKILETARLGTGLLEEYAPAGSKAVVGEVVNYRGYNNNTYLDQLLRKYKIHPWPSILTVNSHSCYGFHRDQLNSIHIPLETNSDCLLVMKEDPALYPLKPNLISIRLEVGYVYKLNTKAHDHTFINGGKTERFHLVGSFEAEEE